MPKTFHRWTEEELDIVRRDYDGTRHSTQRIADRLGVSFFGVKGKVQQLGLAKNDWGQRWTPEQDETLRELITRYAPRTVAVKMGRSINSVVVRSKRLGLSRRVRDGWFTKRDVCEILGVDHKWVQKRVDRGVLNATYHHGHRPKKHGQGSWHITEKALRNYVLQYPEELNGRNVDLLMIVDLLAGMPTINDKIA